MPPSSKRSADDLSEVEESPPKRQAVQENDEEVNISSIPQESPSFGRMTEAGIIKKITVQNFMCHPHLTVNFNRNINFIHGQNGSGKSAILAAIQICLGAGARRTHRARNLKELIRKGYGNDNPQKAIVSVTLQNEGPDAYKHDDYGDSITVQRFISKNGSYNGFKLLDHNGKEISRSKTDLADMLDRLNIAVDNPVSILDQEDAKQFITGKSQDKYTFFLKTTELERIDNTYADTMDRIDEIKANCQRVQDSLASKQDEVDRLKARYEQHRQVEVYEDKLQTYNLKYAWAYYKEQEKLHQQARTELQQFEEKAAAKQQELTQAEEAAQGGTVEKEAREQLIEELTKEAHEHSTMKSKLNEELKKVLLPHKQAERELQIKKNEQREAERQLKAAKKRLQDTREEILAKEGSKDSDRARQTEKIRELEEELSEAKANEMPLKQQMSDLHQQYEDVEPQLQQVKNEARNAERQADGVARTLEELKSSSKNSLAMFGPRVSSVYKKVEEARRKFKGPVVGPIGKYLKMAEGKESYATLAELALPNVFDRWIVTNDHDRNIFMAIRNEVGCQKDCQVFQSQRKPRYNVPGPPEVNSIETVASVLNISDDLVFNTLVDQQKIDRNLLAPSVESSQKHLLEKTSEGHKIRGPFAEVFCGPKGDKWGVRQGHLYIFSNEKKARKLIGTDRTAAIAQAEEELQQLQHDANQHKQEEARLEHKHTQLKRDWNTAKKNILKNQKHIEKLEEQIDSIKSEMESVVDNSIDTSELESAVARDEERVAQIVREYQDMSKKLQDSSPEIAELQKKLDEANARAVKVVADLKAAQDSLTQILDTQTQNEGKLQKKREKLEKYQAAIEAHQEKIESLRAKSADALLHAREFHWKIERRRNAAERETQDTQGTQGSTSDVAPSNEELEAIDVPTAADKPTAYYEKKIELTQKQIDEERKKRKVGNETPEQAHLKYRKARDELNAKVKTIAEMQEKTDEAEQDLSDRRKKWKQLRRHLEKKTDEKFRTMLRVNKYSGSLKFDHKNSDMEIAVQKDANSSGVTKDVKALSGGERSFTTIALLLALGESIETPFRILDEFDVFLDNATRKLVLTSLIHLAKKMDNRQFVFITPQDLSGIKQDPKVKITQLHPPERHLNAGEARQSRLSGFSQSSQD